MSGNLVIDGTQLLMANLAVNDNDFTNDGEYLGGTMGLLRQLGGLINQFNPHSVFVTFDVAKSKHRLALYPEYKAGRHSKVTDELAAKFSHRSSNTVYLEHVLPLLGIHVLTHPEVEADDLIANFVRQSGRRNTIVSTDKDFIQLVSPTTRLYRPIKVPILITHHTVSEVLGHDHRLYTMIRAFEGDVSDNIKGVPGIATKTMLKIFQLVGSTEVAKIYDWAVTQCKFKFRDELIKFIDERLAFNLKLMDLAQGPHVEIKDLIKPVPKDYDAVIAFLIDELKVDDFIQEDDLHSMLGTY